MAFKNDKQRKFLFAMDRDKQKQVPSIKTKVSKPGNVNPTSSPSLPGLPKMAKFGRIKKYFKK